MNRSKLYSAFTALALSLAMLVSLLPMTALAATDPFYMVSVNPYAVTADTESTIRLQAEHYGRPIVNIPCRYEFYVADYTTKQAIPPLGGANQQEVIMPSNAGRLDINFLVNVPVGRYLIAYNYLPASGGSEGPFYYSDFYAGSVPADTTAEINYFAIRGSATNEANRYGVVDHTAGTVTLALPHYHKNLAAASATCTLKGKGTLAVDGVPITGQTFTADFTKPVTLTVTAEDGITEKDYVVSVTGGSDGSEAELGVAIQYYIPGSGGYTSVGGEKDEENRTITFNFKDILSETVLTAVVYPSFGAAVTLDGEEDAGCMAFYDAFGYESYRGSLLFDLSADHTVTITSADGTVSKTYTIIVNIPQPPASWWDEQYCIEFYYRDNPYYEQVEGLVHTSRLDYVAIRLNEMFVNELTFDSGRVILQQSEGIGSISIGPFPQEWTAPNEIWFPILSDSEIELGKYDVLLEVEIEGTEEEPQPIFQQYVLGYLTITDVLPPPSDDATIAYLSVRDGEYGPGFLLTPTFNPEITSYSVSVPHEISAVHLYARPNHWKATSAGDTGTKSLAVGENRFDITVTAEDGVTQKTYTITVTRAAAQGGPEIVGLEVICEPSGISHWNMGVLGVNQTILGDPIQIVVRATYADESVAFLHAGALDFYIVEGHLPLLGASVPVDPERPYIQIPTDDLSSGAMNLGVSLKSNPVITASRTIHLLDYAITTVVVGQDTPPFMATVRKGQSVQLSYRVFPQGYNESGLVLADWQIEHPDGAIGTDSFITKEGLLTVGFNETAEFFNIFPPFRSSEQSGQFLLSAPAIQIQSGSGEPEIIGLGVRYDNVGTPYEWANSWVGIRGEPLQTYVMSYYPDGSHGAPSAGELNFYVEDVDITLQVEDTDTPGKMLIQMDPRLPQTFVLCVTSKARPEVVGKCQVILVDALVRALVVGQEDQAPVARKGQSVQLSYEVYPADRESLLNLGDWQVYTNGGAVGTNSHITKEGVLHVGLQETAPSLSIEPPLLYEQTVVATPYRATIQIEEGEPVLSDDAALALLSVSAGTLTPAFDPNTTSYAVIVPNSADSIEITAEASHGNASVSGAGTKPLAVGENPFDILVTAEDGVTQRTYTVTVTRMTAQDGPVTVSIRTSETGTLDAPAAFLLSLENAKGLMNLSLTFEIDGAMLDYQALETLLDSFDAIDGGSGVVRWTEKEDGIWEGKLLLMYLGDGDGFTSEAKVDIAKVLYNAKAYGDATMKLTGFSVAGLDEHGNGIFLESAIGTAEATISIGKVYSIYDLNKDDAVDERDLAMAQRYYLVKEGDPNWAEAKTCDFDGNGEVNMLDLIDLFLHFA